MVTFLPGPNAPEVVRDGSHLFIALPPQGQAVYLPPVCVKCGQPAPGEPVVKTFSWHHPALYLLILIAVLIYVIVALVVRKTIRVGVPLCSRHAQRRKVWVTLSCSLPLIGIADAFVLPRFDMDPGWVVLIVVGFLLVGLVCWIIASNPIRPCSIDSFRAEFSGFCDAFLDHIPIYSRHY
jgi:hypothetical protein